MAAQKLINARFVAVTESSVTVEFQTATPADIKSAALFSNGRLIQTAAVSVDNRDERSCSARFSPVVFDYSARYEIFSDDDRSAVVSYIPLIDSVHFIKRFENSDTQSAELGAVYGKKRTVFGLWAPFASDVKLKLYSSGTGSDARIVAMKKRADKNGAWGGVWEAEEAGDLNGTFYTFAVTDFGVTTETVDPYARACSVNGMRGMVVDLKRTDPEGWENDKRLFESCAAAADVPIIWETSVKDFSCSVDSGMKYKGKFLAFTERGTTVPGTDIKTGVDHLKELGVTYVHLNPVYDFATVDEAESDKADDSDGYNWGYDPQNYNIPEGSYATDGTDGFTRIREFKQAVKALHDAGIGVIMDVVYNHTYSIGGQSFNDTAPGYYHRTDERASFTNDSGCGNGTASERTMMRKFMTESVLYWANEYHIDGFRFDLMGIHDVATLNLIRAELDKLCGGAGKKILMYGEPWSADGTYTPYSYTARVGCTQKHIAGTGKYTRNTDNRLIKHVFADAFSDGNAFDALNERIAVFNGSGRDGLRGACVDKTPCRGWVNGAPSELGKVKRLIEGGIGGYADGLNVGKASRNVAYASAHDNYTLWDHLKGAKHGDASALFYDQPTEIDLKRNKLVAAAYLMSAGMCFMLAGEEFGRTKYGNEDSYNSPQKLNRINWSAKRRFGELFEHYKKLIALRKKYALQLFSYEKSMQAEFAYGMYENVDYETGKLVFCREKNGVKLVLELDPSAPKGRVSVGNAVYEF